MHPGDILRKFLSFLDETFVWLFGRKAWLYKATLVPLPPGIVYLENRQVVFDQESSKLRAFYETPGFPQTAQIFGIDSLDEMKVELPHKATLNKLKAYPPIGSLIFDDFGGKWQIIQRSHNDSVWFGQSRLVLLCQRYQENVTSGKTT